MKEEQSKISCAQKSSPHGSQQSLPIPGAPVPVQAPRAVGPCPIGSTAGPGPGSPPQQVYSPPGPFPTELPTAGVATVPLLVALPFCQDGWTGLA